LIFTAKDQTHEDCEAALEEVYRTYWPAVYKFIRAKGHREQDAQDLTQEFFHHLQKQNFLSGLQRRVKFRSFLLKFLTNFLSDQYDRAGAQKRGGNIQFISLDSFAQEEMFEIASANSISPEDAFDRRWALAVSEKAAQCLEAEYEKNGRSEQLAALKRLSRGPAPVDMATIAAELGVSESALKSAAHRMRQRLLDFLRAEASNSTDPEEREAEFRYLVEVLGKQKFEV
jgi:RNA polymerase sigma-70 factor (ECF subfamily)